MSISTFRICGKTGLPRREAATTFPSKEDRAVKSVMNGNVAMGLVNVGVKLYSATEDTDLQSHQVHAHDHGKIEYRKVCSACSETVPSNQIAKMFTVDDKSVVLSDDDLSTIDAGKSREISVLEFVPADTIDMMMVSAPYYLGPANNEAMKAYALLVSTLEDSRRVAIVQFTLRSRTRLAALGVTGKGTLVMHALRWPDEVRPAVLPALDTAVLEQRRAGLSDAEKAMASQLVESMTSDGFNPDRYRDSYKTELRELVMSKLDDVVGDAPEDVSDLLAKLERSINKPTPVAVKPNVCKADIRTWARSQGIAIRDRGRIPKDIVDRHAEAMA